MLATRRALKKKPDPFTVTTDFPETLPVTEAELSLLETYLRDVILEMVRVEEAGGE